MQFRSTGRSVGGSACLARGIAQQHTHMGCTASVGFMYKNATSVLWTTQRGYTKRSHGAANGIKILKA